MKQAPNFVQLQNDGNEYKSKQELIGRLVLNMAAEAELFKTEGATLWR
mgnify:CR=1 FL=1